MNKELLTLKEIASRLDISPSLASYYRQQYSEFMPGVKVGRYMKFEPEAIEIMRDIAAGYKNNLQQYEIKEQLSAKYAINIEEFNNKPATTTAQQQQHSEHLTGLIMALNDELVFMREQVKRQQALIEELTRRQLPAGKRRSWWPFKKGKH